jgi:hypothetical protein
MSSPSWKRKPIASQLTYVTFEQSLVLTILSPHTVARCAVKNVIVGW